MRHGSDRGSWSRARPEHPPWPCSLCGCRVAGALPWFPPLGLSSALHRRSPGGLSRDLLSHPQEEGGKGEGGGGSRELLWRPDSGKGAAERRVGSLGETLLRAWGEKKSYSPIPQPIVQMGKLRPKRQGTHLRSCRALDAEVGLEFISRLFHGP